MYSYAEKRERAVAPDATVQDRVTLYEWMETHCMCAWNGESFDIDEGFRLYPVYDNEYDEDGGLVMAILVDAEIR